MAAQHSPVRIDPKIMLHARAAAETFHRKVPEQLSYWAEIGRIVESKLPAAELAYLLSGIGTPSVHLPAQGVSDPGLKAQGLDIIALAQSHQTAKAFKKASKAIAAKSAILYRASVSHPGLLEQIDQEGRVLGVGTFNDGKFKKSRTQTV